MGDVKAEWIALDWGTTRLRAFAIGLDGAVVAEAASDDGMATLAPDAFEPALLRLIEPWLGDGRMLILAAGMVGARQGWIEAPYLAAPCAPHNPARFVKAPTRDARLDIRIAPGVAQADPPDVIRGEETQIAGYLAAHPGFDGVICLPGTHTKWARVSAGEVVGFRSFMTGELFALLSAQSVLRHSMDDGWDNGVFLQAVEQGLSEAAGLTGMLFRLRAEDLLSGLAPGAGRARLSGLLIGAELAAAKGWWLGREVALVAAETPGAHYRAALSAEGVAAPLVPAAEATLAGLAAARKVIGR